MGLDNQPGRTVSLDFVSGLIVGEGSFCLAVQRIADRKGKLRITPIFNLHMVDHETVEIAAETLRAHGLPVYLQWRNKSAGKPQLGLYVNGHKRVLRLTTTFIPLLTGTKRQAAQIVNDFIESRLNQPKGSPYTEDEIEMVRQLRQVNGNHNGRKNAL